MVVVGSPSLHGHADLELTVGTAHDRIIKVRPTVLAHRDADSREAAATHVILMILIHNGRAMRIKRFYSALTPYPLLQ